MKNIFKQKEYWGTIIASIVVVVLVLPSVMITLYSFPCQDDFHYASCARELMDQGYNIFTMAMKMTVEYYMTFVGGYTSSFLGHFFSGIINCNIGGIRIFEFISVLIFYLALYLFLKVLCNKVMGFDKQKILPLYCILVALFNCVIYYSDNDVFYWFITSVQYLFISSFILFGVSSFVFSFYEDRLLPKRCYLIMASILGFLGSGGTLSIAAFGCALYLIVAMWGFFICKQKKYACIGMGVSFLGAVMNGIAPGNYVRDGQPMSVERLFVAVKHSARYTLERWETFVENPVFWIILICMVLILCTCKMPEIRYQFKYPIIFILFLFGLIVGIIFPTMLGYGYECYIILNRGNFISDMAFYLFIFLGAFYIKGWLSQKYPSLRQITLRRDLLIGAGFVITMLLVADRNAIIHPIVKEYQDLVTGRYAEWSEYCVGIYDEIASSNDDVVEIYREELGDITCMMNPQFYIGAYNPEKEYANTTIASFYGKEAVYIFYNEEK